MTPFSSIKCCLVQRFFSPDVPVRKNLGRFYQTLGIYIYIYIYIIRTIRNSVSKRRNLYCLNTHLQFFQMDLIRLLIA